MNLKSYSQTAKEMEQYIKDHLFDPMGIMYSGIDSHTGKPFAPEFTTPLKVPRRAVFNPWAYCTYEDSIMTSGFYIDGMTLKYELTGDKKFLENAEKVWNVVRNIYSCSQVYGIGSFIRPYGGYDVMGQFMEPLGTDQSSPLFSGLYRLKKHVNEKTKAEIERIMLQWLQWYVDQNFQFFYYKSFIAKWNPEGGKSIELLGSYFIPALAWAYQKTGDNQYKVPLDKALQGLKNGQLNVAKTFIWGSDLLTLRDILGESFNDTFTDDVLATGANRNQEILDGYKEPGNRTLMRQCLESLEPGFKPYVDQEKLRKTALGYARQAVRHAGRMWPRHEVDIFMGIAGVGHNTEELVGKAVALLVQRQNVPLDFSHYLPEDYEILPEENHLFARYVGVILVQWWRNYWYLKWILEAGN